MQSPRSNLGERAIARIRIRNDLLDPRRLGRELEGDELIWSHVGMHLVERRW